MSHTSILTTISVALLLLLVGWDGNTVAGNGQKGIPQDGSVATESPLVDPRAVAVDTKNNVYILERGGHALRKVSPDGKIHTVAGIGRSGAADGPAARRLLRYG